MKVLMTADTVGGVWTYAIELARALRPHRVKVLLATMGAPAEIDQRRQAAALENVTLIDSPYKLEWQQDPWADVERAGGWLLDLAHRFRPDVVHLNGYAHGSLLWPAPVMVVGHSCVASWWQAVRREPAPAEWDRYRRAVTSGLRAADLVVAPSHAMLAALRSQYGRLNMTRVIYNGRDAAAYHAGAKQPFVLTAGRLWDDAKNLRALEAVAADLPWPARVAGDATSPDGHVTPPSDNVRYLGKLGPTDMAAQLSQASIYALPARYEPFGLSALEAALSGCALVLGDIDSLREVWGDAALYVDPGDTAALRETLCRLTESASLRAFMAARAADRAARYTPQRMAQEYLHAYQSLAAKRSRDPRPVPDLDRAVPVPLDHAQFLAMTANYLG